jgi:hypothetical protein
MNAMKMGGAGPRGLEEKKKKKEKPRAAAEQTPRYHLSAPGSAILILEICDGGASVTATVQPSPCTANRQTATVPSSSLNSHFRAHDHLPVEMWDGWPPVVAVLVLFWVFVGFRPRGDSQ